MSLPKKDYLEFATKVFELVGLHTVKVNRRNLFSIYFMLPMNLIFAVLIAVKLKEANGSIVIIAAVFESLSTFGQLIVRKLILWIHGSTFLEIIEDRKLFWDYDLCGEELGDKFRKNFAFSQFLIKLLNGIVFSTMIILCLLTIFQEERDLPEICWIPNNDVRYKNIFYACELVFFAEILVFVQAFDGFFVVMCSEITSQFHLLNLEIESAIHEDERGIEKLKICAQHHNHLIKVHHKMNKAYSEYFIGQYLITVMAICIQFFLIMDKSTGFDQILKSFFYLGAVCTQVSVFFFPSTIVSDEAEKLSEVLFNSDWYLGNSLALKRHVLFMLMKAQGIVEMSGGGLFYINRSQFLSIFRISFSIATIMGSTSLGEN